MSANDRITELRALITAERVADGAHRQAPGPGKWAAWQCAEIDLRDAAAESLPALLDCAEALKPFAAIQIAEIAVPVTGDFAVDVLRARKVLARLNGDDHD